MSKKRSNSKGSQKEIKHLLESGNLNDLEQAKIKNKQLLEYHWKFYTELALQRNEIQEEIKKALISNSTSFKFKNWQRAVKFKYGLHPLSTVGSLSYIGGRFNMGKKLNSEMPNFPALYIAKNKDTALQEHLGQEKTKPNSKLTARELALTNPSSEVIVSISGSIDKVLI